MQPRSCSEKRRYSAAASANVTPVAPTRLPGPPGRRAAALSRGPPAADLLEPVVQPVLGQALREVAGRRPPAARPGRPDLALDLRAVREPVLRPPGRPPLALSSSLKTEAGGSAASHEWKASPARGELAVRRISLASGRNLAPAIDTLHGFETRTTGCNANADLGTRLVPGPDRTSGQKKNPGFPGFSYSGGGIRTRDLRVMSPTSYQTAPPRGGHLMVAEKSG